MSIERTGEIERTLRDRHLSGPRLDVRFVLRVLRTQSIMWGSLDFDHVDRLLDIVKCHDNSELFPSYMTHNSLPYYEVHTGCDQ